MDDQARLITDIVEKEVAFRERMQSEAEKTATNLIDNFLGSDQKIINLATFRSALSQALREAREQGQVDLSGDVLTLV
jgi:hypothetical protein